MAASSLISGQHAPVPRSSTPPNGWTGKGQVWDSCRPLGKPPYVPCRSDEAYRPAPGGFAFHTTHAENSPLRPRIVTVVRAGRGGPASETGGRQLRKITILLNRRAVQTFEQLVADISEALGFPRWKNDRVRRLFSLRGREIRSVSDFFRNDDVFVAAGRERPSSGEVQEVLEELFPDSSCFHSTVLQAWERLLRPPVKTSKTDSGFQEEPEPVQGWPVGVRAAGNGSLKSRDRAFQSRRQMHKCEQVRAEGRGGKSRVRNVKDLFPAKAKAEKADGTQVPCRAARSHREPLVPITAERVLPAVGVQDTEAVGVPEEQQVRSEGAGERTGQSTCHPQKLPGDVVTCGVSPSVPETKGTASEGEAECGSTSPGIPQAMTQTSAEAHQESVSPATENSSEHKERPERPLLEGTGAMESEAELPDFLPAGPVLSQSDLERHYEIGRVVGDGNFAVVRECRRRDAGTGATPFAMKIIDRAKLRGKEHMAQNEISIAQSLRHPNVVRFLRHYETAERIYLLMELVAGGDLFDAITENVKFPEELVACLLRDVCEALAYIHAKCIVHRDLKPENLLVQRNADGSTTLKLADFGLATVVTEPIFTVCGTPTYVAPEILVEKGYGLPVDMWAAGVIAYILLCGFAPFRSQDKDQERLFQLIQQGEYEFLSPYWDGVSPGAKDFTGHLLVVDPQTRMTARAALQHPWLQGRGHPGHTGHAEH
ncbi:serine/threonine-protein kinase DCLK3 [Scleropages formosus]|uniref:serine/threonine-protein kinase DCLK3 n=1 Tax=Scleropages formosus TaxID=113540 RepID=UPI0010FA8057|nr:serine/threonine-protein kinase DCLK3 [Scleropages formosus]